MKWSHQIQRLPQEIPLNGDDFNSLLNQHLSSVGSQHRTRIFEAAAIAFYHQQSQIPVIKTLVTDDAPQFKLLTDD
jgi:hypothetical protein